VSFASCLLFFAFTIDQSIGYCNFAYDISIGIFASSFVVWLTYLGAYFIVKKRTVGMVNYYCREYIFEISNLIPLLLEISEDRICRYNWNDIKMRIEHDSNVQSIVQKLLRIHNDRLLSIDGYYPILRGDKKNLQIHHLICMLAKINTAIQYCNTAYKLANNMIYKMEQDDIAFSEENLKVHVDIILQTNGNNEYQRFSELFKIVQKQNPAVSVFNSNWEGKCS